jgi:hypothetical protein
MHQGRMIRRAPAARPGPLPKIRSRLLLGAARCGAAVKSRSWSASTRALEVLNVLEETYSSTLVVCCITTAGRSKPICTVPTDAAKGQLAPPEAKLQRKDFRHSGAAQMTRDRRGSRARRGRVRRARFRCKSVTSHSRKSFQDARCECPCLLRQLPRFRASRVSLCFVD